MKSFSNLSKQEKETLILNPQLSFDQKMGLKGLNKSYASDINDSMWFNMLSKDPVLHKILGNLGTDKVKMRRDYLKGTIE